MKVFFSVLSLLIALSASAHAARYTCAGLTYLAPGFTLPAVLSDYKYILESGPKTKEGKPTATLKLIGKDGALEDAGNIVWGPAPRDPLGKAVQDYYIGEATLELMPFPGKAFFMPFVSEMKTPDGPVTSWSLVLKFEEGPMGYTGLYKCVPAKK